MSRVLLVDDDRDLVEAVARLLTSSGHQVRRARRRDEALAAVVDFRPVLALVDLEIGSECGLELATTMRGMPECAGMGLVAVTGRPVEDVDGQARAAGFDLCLQKPLGPVLLEDLVANWPAAAGPPLADGGREPRRQTASAPKTGPRAADKRSGVPTSDQVTRSRGTTRSTSGARASTSRANDDDGASS